MSRGKPEPRSIWTVSQAIALVACIIIAAAWLLTRPHVKLNESHYATTLALYRVCNQQSREGLEKVAECLATSDPRSAESETSFEAILAIIDKARQEHWQRAAEDCRRLLDQQVQR